MCSMLRISDAVEVGVVLSGASSSLVPFMLRRDRELEVREEDLAVIVDPHVEGYYVLGVIRWVTKYEPFLKRSIHNIYAENPEALDEEIVMPFANAYVEVYAGVCDGGEYCGGAKSVDSNTYAPTPGSRVYKLRSADWLTDYLGLSRGSSISVGSHKYTGWRLPLDSRWTSYHVGVFGATGTGKSRLILRLLRELRSSGFSLIVFDHSGVDYAPRAGELGARVIRSGEIRINPVIYASTVSRYLEISSYQRDAVELVAMCFAMKVYRDGGGRYEVEDCSEIVPVLKKQSRPSLASYASQDSSSDDLRSLFLQYLATAARRLNMRPETVNKIKLFVRLRVPEHLFTSLAMRKLEPSDIVSIALREGIVIIDLSDEQDIEIKRAIVASIAEAGWDEIRHRGEPVNLGLVVDEAQNYACEYCGEAGRALETIAREGRKWGYFIVVASQRISRDIRPGVRSNLGTVFFSKLQSTGDLQELSGYLDLGRVSEASLAMLGRREFYVAGLMNPLRRPILLKIDKV